MGTRTTTNMKAKRIRKIYVEFFFFKFRLLTWRSWRFLLILTDFDRWSLSPYRSWNGGTRSCSCCSSSLFYGYNSSRRRLLNSFFPTFFVLVFFLWATWKNMRGPVKQGFFFFFFLLFFFLLPFLLSKKRNCATQKNTKNVPVHATRKEERKQNLWRVEGKKKTFKVRQDNKRFLQPKLIE